MCADSGKDDGMIVMSDSHGHYSLTLHENDDSSQSWFLPHTRHTRTPYAPCYYTHASTQQA